MWPSVEVLVTVTLRTTAVTPAGIPPLPPIFTRVELYGWTMPIGAPVPLRVSSRRVGAYGVKSEPSVTKVTSLTAETLFAASATVTLIL